MSIIEALHARGFTVVPLERNRFKIGNTVYIVKSVFASGNNSCCKTNSNTMSETLINLAQDIKR